jgi:hypothetical protein
VEPVKPSPYAPPVVVIDATKLEAYSEEYGIGYVILARRAVEKELKRSDEGVAQIRALREVRRKRAIVRNYLETRVAQEKRVQLARMLREKSAEWITHDRVDTAVDAVVQAFYASGRESTSAVARDPEHPDSPALRQ